MKYFFPLVFCEAVALVRQSRPIHVEVSLFHKLRYPRNFFDKNYNNVGAALYQAVVIYLHNMLIVWVNESVPIMFVSMFKLGNPPRDNLLRDKFLLYISLLLYIYQILIAITIHAFATRNLYSKFYMLH